jgi:hypothetical protein
VLSIFQNGDGGIRFTVLLQLLGVGDQVVNTLRCKQ